jgi:GGDEF domain-containing protein
MSEDPESSTFLGRAYRIAKLIAVATGSVAALIVSVVALDVSKGHWWVDIKVPLYAVVLAGAAFFVVCAFVIIALTVVLRDALNAVSVYRNESKNLRATVSKLQKLAYNDPITGIPNSNQLKDEIEKRPLPDRCLILLDLENFGQINKKYNHWVGDEYLRRFAEMVGSSGRRNEYLYKSRPLGTPEQNEEKQLSARQVARAFRKNSGGDEFFIVLEGTVVDALGYLIRLWKRAAEFEAMSFDVMNARHRFGFYAGIVPIALNESFDSVSKRVSECLGLALEDDGRQWVYWVETDIPKGLDSFQTKIVEEAKKVFARHRIAEPILGT